MTPGFAQIPEHFTQWMSEHGSKGPIGELAQWLAGGGWDPAGYHAIVERHGVAADQRFLRDRLDLILGYVRGCLAAGPLTTDKVIEIQFLRRALHVDDSDLFAHRPAEVSAIVQRCLDPFLVDGILDDLEDHYLVEIQTALGLSYDEYLVAARPALERAMAELDWGIDSSSTTIDPDEDETDPQNNLETTYLLASRRHGSAPAHSTSLT